MNKIITLFVQKIGIDKAIAYSVGSRITQGFTGVLSVLFITTFLTGVEQGFYYTFGSLLAMQIFFELGLTGIMTQFVAHEVSHLTLNKRKEYEGEDFYKSRLASLIRFCVKWYFALSVIVFFFLMVVGFTYFKYYGNDHTEVDWQIPWLLICIGTAIKLFQSPLNSIFMGLGFVKEMSKIGFWQQFILPTITWTGLAVGFKLYVVGIGYLASVILWQFFVSYLGLSRIIINLWKVKITERVLYFKEIFPFQWRIALSWMSGYFIFQLFNPVLFATEGAVIAGQMGLTMQLLNAIQSLSFSWLNTKIPFYSQLIAVKDYLTLDTIFGRTLRQMTRVCLSLLCIFLFIIWVLNTTQIEFKGHVLADRFLGYIPLVIMMIPVYLQQYTNSWAAYLRCHKKEPFLVISVVGGISCGLSTFIFGNLYGLYGVVLGYCILTIVLFPWGYWIYKTKKIEWHG